MNINEINCLGILPTSTIKELNRIPDRRTINKELPVNEDRSVNKGLAYTKGTVVLFPTLIFRTITWT